MEHIFMTADSKKVFVNPDYDEKIYSCDARDAAADYYQGDYGDLYAHRAQSGAIYFYIYRKSNFQGLSDIYRLMTEEQVKAFLLKIAVNNLSITDFEKQKIERYFPGLFTEDA